MEIQQPDVGSFALELTLLACQLSESLRIQLRGGSSLVLTRLAADRVPKAVVTVAPDGAMSFALGTNQIESLQSVLLRAYRDEMAEVNHIHVEGERDGNPFDLTFMFGASRPPMSADKAAKLLAD